MTNLHEVATMRICMAIDMLSVKAMSDLMACCGNWSNNWRVGQGMQSEWHENMSADLHAGSPHPTAAPGRQLLQHRPVP